MNNTQNLKLKKYEIGEVVLTESHPGSGVFLDPNQDFIMSEKQLKLLGAKLCEESLPTNS